MLAIDLGDAPDSGPGTGRNNYNTLGSDNGPSHFIVAGLFMGARVDGELDANPNLAANGDDIATQPDDEDGLSNPVGDLSVTIGTQPTVSVIVTNGTAAAATLYGWIDYNADGVFDNATEQASANVPLNTTNGLVTLTFPFVPVGYTGPTYARFRLSTDVVASNPTGSATDGEVEDYPATVLLPAAATPGSTIKIASGLNGGPTLANSDEFGTSTAAIGDLNGDGITDLAVGAVGFDPGGAALTGAVHILFMNTDGTVKSSLSQVISTGMGNGPTLAAGANFGSSVTALGDLDGDGITDLAVGASGENSAQGAVYVLFMKNDGTVKNSKKIASGDTNGPTFAAGSRFGASVTALGDLNSDGVTDLAVGAYGENGVRGAVYVLFMKADGTLNGNTRIASSSNGGPALNASDRFGISVTTLGDMDGDGVTEIAVGADQDDTNGADRGAVYVLFLNASGTAKGGVTTKKIASGTNGGPNLVNGDLFGRSVTAVGDLNGDGVTDLAVGATNDDSAAPNAGALQVLFLNADGSVKSSNIITGGIIGGPVLTAGNFFGRSAALLGDLNGDGLPDLASGAIHDTFIGTNRGAVHVMFLSPDATPPELLSFTRQDPLNATTSVDTLVFRATFSKTVINVNAADFAVTGTTATVTAVTQVSGSVYDITVSGGNLFSLNGDVGLDLGGGLDITDVSGNVLPAVEPLIDEIYTIVNIGSGDFGDAPDTGPGTSRGNYNTLSSDNGPRHTIVAGLFMGAGVESEVEGLPNAAANGDNIDGFPPNDEDGLNNPAADLTLTIGAQPTVNVIVTNTTGVAATLHAWIDYNADGQFDNATERASISVPNATNKGIVTLTFPAIPPGYVGQTYARFRLSSDVAAANPFGLAAGGEVEDYVVTITNPGDGTAKSSAKISDGLVTGPTLLGGDNFGRSVISIGDLDGDGNSDFAVGAPGDDTGGGNRGAVYILFMQASGDVRTFVKIASGLNGGPALANNDAFGTSLAFLGDLNGDGLPDIAVGVPNDDTGAVPANPNANRGAVRVLFLDADGTVKASSRIASGLNGGPSLTNGDNFGISVAAVGDLDKDGITDLVVGATGNDTGGSNRGAVYTVFMKADGSAKSTVRIANLTNGGPALLDNDAFGSSVANLGDIDGDGVSDIAVGASGDDTGGAVGANRGAVYTLLMQTNGQVKASTLIASGTNGGPTLANNDAFGTSVAALGDLDGDGVTDIAVGASSAVHMVFMKTDGSARTSLKFTSGTNGAPVFAGGDGFGISLAAVGDLNQDGITDLAVGAPNDTGGRGAVYVLFLNQAIDYGDAPDTGLGNGTGEYSTLISDNGASHAIIAGIHLGVAVDSEPDAIPNDFANGDDKKGLPDDEDGLANPAADLALTVGQAPRVHVYATNTLAAAATLYGWIDYNQDGIFDNATERAQVSVPSGTLNGLFTLTFANVPGGVSGSTFARFRLSTDPAAANSTGPAHDGEVEDYMATINQPTDGLANATTSKKLASGVNGLPALANGDYFGQSVAAIGDLNGDGINDLAAGSFNNGSNSGALNVLLMTYTGAVGSRVRIANGTGGLSLATGDKFGSAVTSLGDIDGDGIPDLAVGANGDDTRGTNRGAVYVLFMNASGGLKGFSKISSGFNGGPTLVNGDYFGVSVSALGDLDGDGVTDLAVGAFRDGTGGTDRGAVHILFLKSDGTVKSFQKIANQTGGFATLADGDYFGRSVAGLADINGDGIGDLAVGAYGDDTNGPGRGALYVLFLNRAGTVTGSAKIASGTPNGPELANGDLMGVSVAAAGDLDGDGVHDLAVGAFHDDLGGTDRGAVYLIRLNSNGSVKETTKLANLVSGGPSLNNFDFFGVAVASLGDITGDGVIDLAIGANGDDTNGNNRGAVYILTMNPALDFGDAPDPFPTLLAGNGARHISSGATLGALRDTESDGVASTGAVNDDLSGIDDEDGFVSQSILAPGQAGSVVVNVQGVLGTYRLNAWIDFNRDGDWLDPGEQIANDFVITTNGDHTLNFTVPVGAQVGNGVARFRLSTATGLSFFGPAPDGEVEDHIVAIGPQIDLGVTQTESGDPVVAGSGNLTYVVTVKNNGTSNATGIKLSEDLTLPAGVSVVSISPDVGTFAPASGPNGVWTVGNLSSGAEAKLTITLAVGASAAHGATIVSVATVTASNETRVNTADDSVTTTTLVERNVDIVVTQTESAATITAGAAGNLTYEVTVKNNGPSAATGVVLNESLTLPAGVSVVSITPSTGPASFVPAGGPSGVWTVGNLASGGTATLTVIVSVGASTAAGTNTIVSTATLSSVSETQINTGNESATQTTSVTRLVDLVVTQTESADPVNAGSGVGNLVYQVTVTNSGPSNAGGVTLNEVLTLPAGVSVESITPSTGPGSFAPAAGPSGVWTIGNLASGGSATLRIELTVGLATAPGTNIISSTASVATVTETQSSTANDTASDATSVVVLDFGDAPAPFPTLLANNGARHSATGATLGATRDNELNGQPSALANGDDANGIPDEDGLVSQSVLAAGGSGSVTVNVQGIGALETYFLNVWIDFNQNGSWADAGEQVATDFAVTTNGNQVLNFSVPSSAAVGNAVARFRLSTASGLSFTGFAPDGEVEDHLLAVVRQVDLIVSQTGPAIPVVAGSANGNLTYVVTVHNNGPSNASGVVLSENLNLPAGVTVFSITPDVGAGTYSPPNGPSGTWNLGNLASGADAKLTIVLTVGPSAATGTDTVSSTATVTASAETRINQGDDSSLKSTSVTRQVDLVVSQSESDDPINAGSGNGNLTYIVTVSNIGPSDASGVVLDEVLTLPAGVSVASITPSTGPGTFSPASGPSGTWTVGDLSRGASATLNIVLTVGASTLAGTDTISSTAAVTASNETRINTGNDSSTVSTSVEVRPTAVITGSTSVGEGLAIPLLATDSFDPNAAIISFQWDLNFNGTFNPTVSASSVTFSAIGLDGPSSRVVALRVTNSLGVQSKVVTQTINILNRNPSITSFQVPLVGFQGLPTSLAATAEDPAGAFDPLTFTWTITRPDTSTFTLSGANASFTPDVVGLFGVRLTVTDGDGGSATQAVVVDASFGPGIVTTQLVTPNPKRPQKKQLIITGDDQFNQIALDLGVGGRNTVRVRGLNGTKINGAADSQTFSDLGLGITVLLLSGKDVITVNGTNFRGPITLDAGDGDDEYRFASTRSKLVVNDVGGIDTFNFLNEPNSVRVDLSKQTGKSQSLRNGNTLKLTGQIEILIGTPFNDILKGNGADNIIYGLGGRDKIDGGAGNDILRGGDGDDTITDASGNNILLGEAGADRLTGAKGNKNLPAGFDLLIGGIREDKLTAGKKGNALMIGGTTDFDNDDEALLAILAEWSNAAETLANRVGNLQTGVGPGNAIKLTTGASATVIDDALVDTLKNVFGNNWIFQSPGDKLTGKKPASNPIDIVQP